jgi:hypothetical protein
MRILAYLILVLGVLFLIGTTAYLHQNQRFLSSLPEIIHSKVTELNRCAGKTAMARIGCANGVHFTDIRKLDMRRDNRILSRDGVSALFTKAR